MSICYSVAEGVATITLNRPEKLNALTDEMWDQFADALERCRTDDAVRAVILTGTGRGFCAGGDISGEGRVWPRKSGPAGTVEIMERYNRIIRSLYHLPKPVIAGVNGVTVGIAWTLVLCCDAVLVTDAVKFSSAFLNLAKVPEGGFQYLAIRRVGQLKARQLIYESRVLSGAEAVEWGFANRLVSADKLLEEANTLASNLGRTAPMAFALTKQLFNDDSDDFEGFLQKELHAIALAANTEDAKEGMTAFREKRLPQYRGV